MALPEILKSTIDRAKSNGSTLMWAFDFDGTLSNYVDFHDEAEPVSGVTSALAALSNVGIEVVIVSGRPIVFLEKRLGKQHTLIGSYGAEFFKDGKFYFNPNTGNWPAVIQLVTKEALDSLTENGVPFGLKARDAHEAHAVYVERKPISTHFYPCVPPDTEIAENTLLALKPLNLELHGLELDIQSSVFMLRPKRFWNLFGKDKALETLIDDSIVPIFSGDDPSDIGCAQLVRKFNGVAVAVDNEQSSLRPGTPTGLIADSDLILTGSTTTAQEQLIHLMLETADYLS